MVKRTGFTTIDKHLRGASKELTVIVAKKAPMCEECDEEMNQFAAHGFAGWSCDSCGWSFDTETRRA